MLGIICVPATPLRFMELDAASGGDELRRSLPAVVGLALPGLPALLALPGLPASPPCLA
jgi:hypothetical protein